MIKNGDRVHIVSDGDWMNTKVLDETGEIIPMVYSASWENKVGEMPTATLKIRCPDLDAWGKVSRIEVEPYPKWVNDELINKLEGMIRQYQESKRP